MADKSFLEWPFFEDRHRALAAELDNWAGANLGGIDHSDTDAACRALVAALGEAGWTRHSGAEAGETLDVRTLCLIRETLARHEAVAFAGAIGQPDAHSGELPCAFVELVDGASVSEQELLEYCKIHVHERAAIPKHLTVLDELPKTAVGKVFKPDLRKLAITRVYNGALEKAGVAARVVSVIDDKKRGLVAQVAANGSQDADINGVLNSFTRPWEPAAAA